MKKLHPLGLLLHSFTCLLLCATIAPAKANIRREAKALVNWKTSLASADGSLSSWLLANSTSPCHWMHITCNADGSAIRKLNISDASLNGTLDEFDFSAFPHLKKLILFQNDLYGTIPAGIGDLASLVQLEIIKNKYLMGTIPRSIGRLKQLTTLQLEGLGLDGALPEEIGNLTSLRKLSLHSINLTGSIPSTIGALTKLRLLHLRNTKLTGCIPLEIGNMTELLSMDLSQNYLQGQIPDTVSRLVKLRILELSKNQLGGHIIPELGNSSIISYINIARNSFSGAFPPSICMGGALTVVNAEYNKFTSLDDLTFQNCTTLEHVEFTENNIVADLRGCFGKSLENLRSLILGKNQLHGTLLTDQGEIFLCNSTYLELLVLSSNNLHGHLSKCLWDLPYLQFVDLSSNSFSGVVPFSATPKLVLKSLHLANNNFRGNFPSVLKKSKRLVTLDMGGNNFSGAIPSWISKSLPRLRFLLLSSNMFDGIIPPQILQFRQLQLLDLSKNKLTGPIPNDFANFTGMTQEQVGNMTYRFLQAEKLQIVWKNGGYVYTRTIAFMAGIDLSCNLLSQEIPKGLTTLLGVRYLNLSRNHLSGGIPRDIGNLALLESLDLSQNQLSGEIPPSIADLKDLGTLNLSSNSLSGRIPTGSQLQTFLDPSIYSNNHGLCGSPLQDCVNPSASKQNETDQDEDRETLLLYCFVAAGVIFGFWLYWSMLLFCNKPWICEFYQQIDNIQDKVITKIAAYRTCGLE
ncbi:uncharacterized protein [Lolium perenne]|jgi:Leucine-rich repeat (LRR) protein|uniref:uncharacterized protein n=1 Tax=Lolium perenne TaxID=4522 RepID=UPI0021EB2699